MVSRRLVIFLIVLAAAFGGLFAAAPGARRHGPPPVPAAGLAAQSGAGSPTSGPDAPAADSGDPGAAARTGLDGPARLEAVRTVKLFCDLVDAGRLWEAAGLFAAQRVWTRAQLRSIRALSFRSARVLTAPDPATVTVVARVHASVRPQSPVPPGATTLFFTLGRVGTTVGGWLIHAVTAPTQPQRKGSQ